MENARKYLLKEGTELNGKNGKYTIKTVIASGGSGVTYKAQSKTNKLYYCIKECYPHSLNNNIERNEKNHLNFLDSLEMDKESAENRYKQYKLLYEQEKKRVLEISQDDGNNDYSILSLVDSFDENGFRYNVYQTASSNTLWDEFLKDGETLSPSRVKWYLEIFIKLLQSLQTLHEQKRMLHLDISPDNTLIMGEKQQTVRIIDYGSAISIPGKDWKEKSITICPIRVSQVTQLWSYANILEVILVMLKN